MNKIVASLAFSLLVASGFPCAAIPLQRSVSKMIDDLALAIPTGEQRLSKIGVGILPLEEASPLARRYEVGSSIGTLIGQSIARSLVFTSIDITKFEKSLQALERALALGVEPEKLPEPVFESMRYLIIGSVTQDGDQFRIVLRLVETLTTSTVKVTESLFPVTELVSLSDSMFKAFSFIGVSGSVEWDMYSYAGGTYGPRLWSTSVTALIPLKTVYARFGARYLAAEGSQSESYLGLNYGVPADASGSNEVRSIMGLAGMGVFVPIRYGAYGHFGLDVAFGASQRKSLIMQRTGDGTYLSETDFSETEACIDFGLCLGAAFKLTELLVLDIQTGIMGKTFGLLKAYATEGFIVIPITLTIAVPF